MKITKRVKTECAFISAVLLTLPCLSMLRTHAAEAIDLDAECSITVSVAVGENNSSQKVEYVEDLNSMSIPIDLYKVADVDVTGQRFTPVAPFESMDFSGIDSETNASEWLDKAEEAAKNKNLAQAVHWETYTVSGTAKFGESEENGKITPGMYLVAPEATYNEDYTIQYTFSPYLTVLPGNDYASAYDSDGNPVHTDTENNTLGDGWNYHTTIGLKPEALPQYGELNITKILDNFNETLGKTTFVFEVRDRDGNSYSEVTSTTHESLAEETVTLKDIPAGITVTVTEVYFGASYEVVGDKEKEVKIWSKAAVEAAQAAGGSLTVGGETVQTAAVSFENQYNGGNRGGYGVRNEFTDGGADGWSWNPVPVPEAPSSQENPQED